MEREMKEKKNNKRRAEKKREKKKMKYSFLSVNIRKEK